MDITIQQIRPEIEVHSEPGWRRAEWLLQRRLEKEVAPQDLILRQKNEKQKIAINKVVGRGREDDAELLQDST